jgi:Arc/MetJ-type ribon-helix-helix transcriptional regulator
MVKHAGIKRKYTTITIPAPLFQRLQERIKNTGFSSVSDYVTYILRETTSEMEMRKAGKKDTEGVLEKLRALGYA